MIVDLGLVFQLHCNGKPPVCNFLTGPPALGEDSEIIGVAVNAPRCVAS
jgi:hypothetical protein